MYYLAHNRSLGSIHFRESFDDCCKAILIENLDYIFYKQLHWLGLHLLTRFVERLRQLFGQFRMRLGVGLELLID